MPIVKVTTRQGDWEGSFDGHSKPNVYRGVLFRSKLESRWARYLDSIPLRWSYEPVTLHGASGKYRPDFALLDCDVYLEIKPDSCMEPTNRLGIASVLRPVIVVFGPPKAFLVRVHLDNRWMSEKRRIGLLPLLEELANRPETRPPHIPKVLR